MRVSKVCLAIAVAWTACVAMNAQAGSGSQSSSSKATQPQVKKVAAPYTDPTSGVAMYKAYCASCHGAEGRGDGPAAPALKTPPTDLTRLAAGNGGKFPDAHVVQVIKGDVTTAAHGNKDMPVWGPVFLGMGQRSTAQVQLRISNLVKYLESIQQR